MFKTNPNSINVQNKAKVCECSKQSQTQGTLKKVKLYECSKQSQTQLCECSKQTQTL